MDFHPDDEIKHPDKNLVVEILAEIMNRRKHRELRIDVINFDQQYQSYIVGFIWKNFFETMTINVELIDEAARSKGVFRKTKIKAKINQV